MQDIVSQKALNMKYNLINYTSRTFKTFAHPKDDIKKRNKKAIDWEKIFAKKSMTVNLYQK